MFQSFNKDGTGRVYVVGNDRDDFYDIWNNPNINGFKPLSDDWGVTVPPIKRIEVLRGNHVYTIRNNQDNNWGTAPNDMGFKLLPKDDVRVVFAKTDEDKGRTPLSKRERCRRTKKRRTQRRSRRINK